MGYSELNVTSLQAMASEISLEEIASEVRGQKYFCARLGITMDDVNVGKRTETAVGWCGNGSRRRGRRRRHRPDCAGDKTGCLCGFNIDEPNGGSQTVNGETCDTTKCGFKSGRSWSLTWKA